MDLSEAIKQYVDMLVLGSSALRCVISQVAEAAQRDRIVELLDTIAIQAAALESICW